MKALSLVAATVFLLTGCTGHLSGLRPAAKYEPITHTTAQIAAPYSPSSGPALHCLVERGSARFPSGWHDLERSSFRLSRGQKTQVIVSRPRGNERMNFLAQFDASGQKLLFCPFTETATPGSKIECASLYALEDDFGHGLRRTLDVPGAIRGGQIRCSHNPSFLTAK